MPSEAIPPTLSPLRVPLGGLVPYARNPRQGNVGALVESLRRHGQYRPIVVNARTQEVLAGNHTLAAARELGWSEIAATFVDVDEDQAARIVLVDNRSNDLASYDDAGLLGLLQSLPDLEGTGYDGDALDALLKELNPPEPELPSAEEQTLAETFDVLVSCDSEASQLALLERLTEEGLECRALLS